MKLKENFSTAWCDEKGKIPKKEENIFSLAFLIQFGGLVVEAYCSLSGVMLCMLFHWTYNQYYFNYIVEFFYDLYFLLFNSLRYSQFPIFHHTTEDLAGFYCIHFDKPQK